MIYLSSRVSRRILKCKPSMKQHSIQLMKYINLIRLPVIYSSQTVTLMAGTVVVSIYYPSNINHFHTRGDLNLNNLECLITEITRPRS